MTQLARTRAGIYQQCEKKGKKSIFGTADI
jgi:hypothetical protein